MTMTNQVPKSIRILLISLIFGVSLMAYATPEINTDKNGLALSGYDPVSYFMSKPMKGYAALKYSHQGIIYHFENEENRQAFISSPDKYIPAYGGWCAWAMLEGEKVTIDPMSYKIINGKNYVFYNGFWGNTLQKWNVQAGKSSETTLVNQANQQWQRLKE